MLPDLDILHSFRKINHLDGFDVMSRSVQRPVVATSPWLHIRAVDTQLDRIQTRIKVRRQQRKSEMTRSQPRQLLHPRHQAWERTWARSMRSRPQTRPARQTPSTTHDSYRVAMEFTYVRCSQNTRYISKHLSKLTRGARLHCQAPVRRGPSCHIRHIASGDGRQSCLLRSTSSWLWRHPERRRIGRHRSSPPACELVDHMTCCGGLFLQ